ncbi:MAG: pyridine nucleotide-disulfide oxidoreductase, partial [Candidatus Competibacteraceae bacterium]|nr:pyridine nucleotide-disulfide oxidoreductase [Candidatus Competibacteraceae bacterium]
MNKNKLIVLIVIAGLVAAFFAFDLDRFFSLEFFKTQQAAIETYTAQHPLQSALIYFAVYVLVTALSLPGAAIMTLVGGAIFGLLWGTVLVS